MPDRWLAGLTPGHDTAVLFLYVTCYLFLPCKLMGREAELNCLSVQCSSSRFLKTFTVDGAGDRLWRVTQTVLGWNSQFDTQDNSALRPFGVAKSNYWVPASAVVKAGWKSHRCPVAVTLCDPQWRIKGASQLCPPPWVTVRLRHGTVSWRSHRQW